MNRYISCLLFLLASCNNESKRPDIYKSVNNFATEMKLPDPVTRCYFDDASFEPFICQISYSSEQGRKIIEVWCGTNGKCTLKLR